MKAFSKRIKSLGLRFDTERLDLTCQVYEAVSRVYKLHTFFKHGGTEPGVHSG